MTLVQEIASLVYEGDGGGDEAEATAAFTTARISTGMWGCGVFNGEPTLKLLQQIMAASE